MAHIRTTLIHLSDVHFGSQHGFARKPADPYDRGRGSLLDYLNTDTDKLACKPDILIISGDLTSKALTNEFQEAHDFITAWLARHKLTEKNLIVIPGNHDAHWRADKETSTLADYQTFASRLFKVSVPEFEIRYATHGDTFVLGLDATRLETPKTGGIGFIGRDQLQKAEDLLRTEGKGYAVRILVIHHHLLPVTWIGDRPDNYPTSITIDAPAIIAWAQEHGFAAILHGHQHQTFLSTFHFPGRPHGPLIISGAPSLGANRDALPNNGRNGYQILTVESSDIEIETRLLDESNQFTSHSKTPFIFSSGRAFAKSAFPGIVDYVEPPLEDTRRQCLVALESIRRILTSSYGPDGGLRSIRGHLDHVRDGNRIIETLDYSSPLNQRVTQFMRSLMQTVSAQCGDGRKTAALMAIEMAKHGLVRILEGIDDNLIASSIMEAATVASAFIRDTLSKPVTSKEDLIRIAETAMCGNRDIAVNIATAYEGAGMSGLVVIEQRYSCIGKRTEVHLEERMTFSVNPPAFLAGKPGNDRTMKNCMVVVANLKVGRDELICILEIALSHSQPLLLVVDDIDEEGQELLAINLEKRTLDVIPVLLRGGHGERRRAEFMDLAVVTGARFFDSASPLYPEQLSLGQFGLANEVTVHGDKLLIRASDDSHAGDILRVIKELDRQIRETDSEYDRERFQIRRARMLGATASLSVFGMSENDAQILRGLVNDGVHAVGAAIRGGGVSGGGVSFAAARRVIAGKYGEGGECVRKALVEPLRTLTQRTPELLDKLDAAIERGDSLTFDTRTGLSADATSGPLDPAISAAELLLYAADTASRIVKTRSWELAGNRSDEVDGNRESVIADYSNSGNVVETK